MSGITTDDVERLLEEESAKIRPSNGTSEPPADREEPPSSRRGSNVSLSRSTSHRPRSSERSPARDRSRSRSSHHYRQRSAHRDDRDRRRRGDSYRGGDYYRSGRRRSRERSRSPDRYYRPEGREGRDSRDGRDSRRDRDRGRRGGRRRTPTPPPEDLGSDERDRRTVFVQQLAGRLRTRELIEFFEKVGPVTEAQIVKDKVSKRSKGVGYVEFKHEDSVAKALQLTGQKLAGVPIIVQLTEAEKNRQAREPANQVARGTPFHRLYVGNIHFSLTENDLRELFGAVGELEFIKLQMEEGGLRSKGFGFIQYANPENAKTALETFNGFEIAGRPLRVGLGNDKFAQETAAKLNMALEGAVDSNKGSAFSGSGGRGQLAGGSGGSFDRATGRAQERNHAGASALDDSDVVGVNYANYSRISLMRKLARTEEEVKPADPNNLPSVISQIPAVPEVQPGRCIVIRNMFDPATEEGPNWVKDLEDETKEECTKFGKIVHIAVDPNSAGDVYMKFADLNGSKAALNGLNGRFFGGRQISASYIADAFYTSIYPESAKY